MKTMNVSLPDAMRSFIEEQTKTGGFSTASEYVRSLVREDQKSKSRERLEALLLEGLESGEAQELTAGVWEEVRGEVLRHLEKRGSHAR
jgi:antitoxin ParD1/3/4